MSSSSSSSWCRWSSRAGEGPTTQREQHVCMLLALVAVVIRKRHARMLKMLCRCLVERCYICVVHIM